MHPLARLSYHVAIIAALVAACPDTTADDSPFTVIAPYVDSQTFLIGRLDVKQLPLNDLKPRFLEFLGQVTGDPGIQQQVEPAINQALQMREGFLTAGGQDVFLIVSPLETPYQPPLLVVTAADPQKLAAVESFTRQLMGPAGKDVEIRRSGDRALLVGSVPTLERFATLKAEPRAEVLAAANAAADAPIQFLITPSVDHHRVIRETFPSFPAPWQHITGQALSDGLQWGVLTLEATPTLTARLIIESKDTAAAEELKRVVDSSLDAAVQLPIVQQTVPQADQLRKLIAPAVEGKRVTVSLTEDAATLQAVSKPLAAALTTARGSARRQMSVNNLKQIALAMHVYHDKNKRFPPAANCDAAGKPLLSWRVHILPYLEQQALYDQFKLDEPWDSEHNKKLAETMPGTYVDPAANLKPGMTTYVVPTGEGTVFGGKESLRIQDIRDGTSNTIMVVNVTPDRAVIWTKPEDLPVKETEPLTGLINGVRKKFETAFCDGSVRTLSDAIDPKILWLLFNANDGKPIDYDQIR